MRERFFKTYQTIVFKKCYYKAHQRKAEKWLFFSKVACAFLSILSVLAWGITRTVPLLWACLITTAQLMQSMLDQLPWSQRTRALHFLLPALDQLILDIDEAWLRNDYAEADDASLMEQVTRFERTFFEIESKYTADVWFSSSAPVMKAADEEWDNYFQSRYHLPTGAGEREHAKPERSLIKRGQEHPKPEVALSERETVPEQEPAAADVPRKGAPEPDEAKASAPILKK